MCVSLIFSNMSFALWPIFLVEFKDIWMLTNTDVGWISGSYFIGYLLLTPVYVGLTDKYDAVKFAKQGSEIIGGKGGGGRKDFAQAGGQDQSKINQAFEKIKSLI